jgi:copper(I)-binding protein
MRMRRRSAILVASVALVLAGCSEEAALTVEGAWARSPMEDVGAAYFTVTNDGSDAERLVAAAAEIADRVEIHETVMEDGQAEMRQVDGVVIPAGETMAFEPGGYHIMLLDLREPLVPGDTIRLSLTFEEAGEIEVDAEVREFVEGDMEDGGGM